MAQILILGGTRNLGHVTARSLIHHGHDVAVLNRGRTPDSLPREVERLRGDRTDIRSMKKALGQRSFDLILDNTTYTETDATQAVELFNGRTGRYVFISSGQVYLVREGLGRPFHERDYDGPVMPEPARDSADHASWLYGIDKRLAEQVFAEAIAGSQFPVTTLRLPMVASERDHYGRIQGYVARFLDGGPLLIPAGEGLPLRHVYVNDVAELITSLIRSKAGIGESINVSYGESMTLDAFLDLLADHIGSSSEIMRVDRAKLVAAGLLPDCSPFSGKWMSELDNSLSIEKFGIEYTSPELYLPEIADDYRERWRECDMVPSGYAQRDAELKFAATSSGQ
jgi:nucleoside-diphosphate-sugar epimerase